MTQPLAPTSYQAPAAVTADPSRGMTIAGVVLAFLMPFVGLIFSIVSYRNSKKVGFQNTLARTGIILSIVMWVVYGVGYMMIGGALQSAGI